MLLSSNKKNTYCVVSSQFNRIYIIIIDDLEYLVIILFNLLNNWNLVFQWRREEGSNDVVQRKIENHKDSRLRWITFKTVHTQCVLRWI